MMAQDSTHPDGVASTDRGGAALTRAKHRKQNAALQMKLAGAFWDEIAEVVGYPTARSAKVAVEKALERELQDDPKQKNRMRDMAGKRLEQMLRSSWKKANDPNHPEHLAAQGRCREVIKDYVKLYGLEAPAEMIVHTPTREELEAWVGTVSKSPVTALEEDDIFDVEWVEEEQHALPAE